MDCAHTSILAAFVLVGGCHGPRVRSPDGFVAHVASRHLGGPPPSSDDLGSQIPEDELNEWNPGLGADWEFSSWRFEAGAFVNSLEDLAPYVAGHWVALRSDRFEGGLTAGVALYDEPSYYPLIPMVGPWGAVRIGPAWARVIVAPGLDSNLLLAFSLRFPIP